MKILTFWKSLLSWDIQRKSGNAKFLFDPYLSLVIINIRDCDWLNQNTAVQEYLGISLPWEFFWKIRYSWGLSGFCEWRRGAVSFFIGLFWRKKGLLAFWEGALSPAQKALPKSRKDLFSRKRTVKMIPTPTLGKSAMSREYICDRLWHCPSMK